MKTIDAQLKQLRRLQKKGIKHADKLNELALKQMREYEFSNSLRELSQKSAEIPKLAQQGVQGVKDIDLFSGIKTAWKKCRRYGIIFLTILGVGILCNLLLRRYRRQKENLMASNRFDLIHEVGDETHSSFDFDHASLEELEEALLRVENDLNHQNQALNE